MAVAEPVVEEEVAQATDDTPQVDEVAPVEPETASTDADTSDVEESDSSEAVPDTEPETESPPDLSAIDLKLLRELRPDLIEAQENATLQRERDRLRKEAGTEAGTRAAAEGWLRRVGIDPSSVKDQSAVDSMYQNAHASVTEEMQQSVQTAMLNRFFTDPALRGIAEETLAGLEGADLGKKITSLLDSAVIGTAQKLAGDISLADVPEDTPLRKEITAEVARLLAVELKVKGIKANDDADDASDLASALLTGAVASAGEVNPLLIKLEQEGPRALTPEERTKARELLGLKAT